MPRYTGPGRFTALGGNAQSRLRLTDLQSKVRKIVGDLENQIKLGNIWYGKRVVDLGGGASVVATVDRTFPDNPIIQAVLRLSDPDIEEEDTRRIFEGGFIFRDTENEEIVLSPVEEEQSYVIRLRVEGVSPYVPRVNPKLYGTEFPSGLEFGNLDWQGVLGEDYVLTWGESDSLRHEDNQVASGVNIYRRGVKHARVPNITGFETLMGVAITSDKETLVAIVWDWDGSNQVLVGYERLWSDTPYTYNGMKDVANPDGWVEIARLVTPEWNNGNDRFSPTSVFAFSVDGSEGSTILTGLNDKSAFAEVQYATGIGFSADYKKAGFLKPDSDFYIDTVNVTDSVPAGESKLLNAFGTEEGGYQSAQLTLAAFPSSTAPFSLSSDIPIAVDYINNTKQRLAFILNATSLSMTSTYLVSETFEVQATWNSSSASHHFSGHKSEIEGSINGSGAIEYSYDLYINNNVVIPNAFYGLEEAASGVIQGSFGEPQPGVISYYDLSGTINIGSFVRNSLSVVHVELRAGIIIYEKNINSIDETREFSGQTETYTSFNNYAKTFAFRNLPFSTLFVEGSSGSSSFDSLAEVKPGSAGSEETNVYTGTGTSGAGTVHMGRNHIQSGTSGPIIQPLVHASDPRSGGILDAWFVKIYIPAGRVFAAVLFDSSRAWDNVFYLEGSNYSALFSEPVESSFWDFLSWDDVSVI